MLAKKRWNAFKATVFALLVVAILGAAMAYPTPVLAQYCGKLNAYTQLRWTGRELKPALYVWKNGAGKPNPTNMVVMYNKQAVPNTDKGILTGSPQADLGNGWVVYYISKTWAAYHPLWDDDGRWFVSGCVQ